MKCENFDELYNFLFNLTDIIPIDKPYVEFSSKFIGIVELSCYDITKNIIAINSIMELDIKLDNLYIINTKSFSNNLAFKNLLKLYENFITVVENDTNIVNTKLDIINKHLKDNIYVFDVNNSYKSLRYTIEQNTIYNLQYAENKLLMYKNSAFSYKMHDDSIYFAKTQYNNTADYRIPLLNDFLLPANIFTQELSYLENIDLNVIVYLHAITNNIVIDYIKCNESSAEFDYDKFNKQVYIALNNNISFRKNWYNIFPEYTKDFSNTDFYSYDIDTVFLNSANSEITVENVNNYASTFYLPSKNTVIFDNVDVSNPENNIVQQLYRLNKTVPINILYNNTNQLFDKLPNIIDERPYGSDRFDQTVKYLIDNSESDILVIIGDKIIITKELTFNPKNIWSGYVVDGLNIFGYVNIFNIKLMKHYGIEYRTFSDFIKQITDMNLQYSYMYPEIFGMVLPVDFDKYNGNIFRTAGTKRQIIFNYFIDNYNYNFNAYENDNRYNQL